MAQSSGPRRSTPASGAGSRANTPPPGNRPPAGSPAGIGGRPGAGDERFEPGPVYLGFAYAFGVLLGLILGLYGAFLVPAGPRPGGFLLSYGVALAAVGNPLAAMLVRSLTGTRLGAMTVLIGWAPVAVWFGTSRPEGDLILQGDAKGYLFLAVGALAPVAVAVIGRTSRGLTALPPSVR